MKTKNKTYNKKDLVRFSILFSALLISFVVVLTLFSYPLFNPSHVDYKVHTVIGEFEVSTPERITQEEGKYILVNDSGLFVSSDSKSWEEMERAKVTNG